MRPDHPTLARPLRTPRLALACALLGCLVLACRSTPSRPARAGGQPAPSGGPAATRPGQGPGAPAPPTTGTGPGASPSSPTAPAGSGAGSHSASPPAPQAPAPPPRPDPPQLPGAVWVLIENSQEARPQAGLDAADLVFEAEAEGGITRFLAAFYRQAAGKVGPVRSARYYFLHLVKPYGGPLAHAGGNPDALAMLAADRSYQDMDEIYGAGAWFWRAPDRRAPHNLYTSTDLQVQGARARGYTLRPLPDLPTGDLPAGGAPARRVVLRWPIEYTQVEWRWEGGRWWRYQDGLPHTVEGGTQVAADNLVVMAASAYGTEYPPQLRGEWQRTIGVTGQGEAWFFRGGQVFRGRWQKPAPDQHLSFTLPGGRPFPFAPGQTWVAIVAGPEGVAVLE